MNSEFEMRVACNLSIIHYAAEHLQNIYLATILTVLDRLKIIIPFVDIIIFTIDVFSNFFKEILYFYVTIRIGYIRKIKGWATLPVVY